MTPYQIKPLFQSLLRPVTSWFCKYHVTANHITLAALALSLFTGSSLVLVAQPVLFLLSPIMLSVCMTFNAPDGMLACECDQQTRLGAVLNETDDVISDIALYSPLLFLPESNMLPIILMLSCTILTESCGLLVQAINDIRSFAGPFGKNNRMLIFSLWGLTVAAYPQWIQWNNLFWSIVSILFIWTAISCYRSVLLMNAGR